jgi:hypothetical protein
LEATFVGDVFGAAMVEGFMTGVADCVDMSTVI